MNRRRFLIDSSAASGLMAGVGALPMLALADGSANAAAPETAPITRAQSVRVLAEGAPNSLDPHGDGFNRESLGAFTNVYDTLIQFDRTAVAGSAGFYHYDYRHFTGALAQTFTPLDGGKSWRFHLRDGATFHSGRPVDAHAVKWSLDRAVTLPGSKQQLSTGSMTDPSQFVVEDPLTLRIDLPRADRYLLPNLALTYGAVLDAGTIQAHATQDDPWARDWLRAQGAGGGAFKVAAWTPGQRIAYTRFDAWRSGRDGALPYVRQAIAQAMPDAANRVAALSRGDADIVLQLRPNDFDAAGKLAGVRPLSIPLTNAFRFLSFNVRAKPFDDPRVRQAIAYALPYQAMFDGVARGHGAKLFGAKPFDIGSDNAEAPVASFPQPYPYDTRIARAQMLLRDAGLPNGFATTLSYSSADVSTAEPTALLIQQALQAIGIRIQLEKVPGTQWAERETQKTLPLFIDWSSAWFNEPDYFYRIFFEGDWRWNFSSYDDPALKKLTDTARWLSAAGEQAQYEQLMRKAAARVMRNVPLIPLWTPSFDVAMRRDLTGFTYYVHGQVDFRTLARTASREGAASGS
ncbi:ABC transporter substrate-binding protein [Robbsia sp. KACC 23696]|uniref:ABC transporter substrate-binding protein n=1 Tax=Robbsia sp. KACC 23696 TaxID=3149231 RepID=UPI00325BBC46